MTMVSAIKRVAMGALLCCLGLLAYCGPKGIWTFQDYRNYTSMKSVSEPIVEALANGSLALGSTRQQLLAIDTPTWIEDFGKCKIYGFRPKQGYESQTVVTVDDRVVSARVGSCTWHWTFFDEIPEDVAASVGLVRGLRDVIERMPHVASSLQPMLDKHLAKLEAK